MNSAADLKKQRKAHADILRPSDGVPTRFCTSICECGSKSFFGILRVSQNFWPGDLLSETRTGSYYWFVLYIQLLPTKCHFRLRSMTRCKIHLNKAPPKKKNQNYL